MGFTFLGYKFEHTNRRRVPGGSLVRGTVYWTLDPVLVNDEGLNKLTDDWSNQGYKLGFLINQEQTIEKLVYGGVSLSPLRPQAAAVADLEATHGTPANFKWEVWGGRGKRTQGRIRPNIITISVEMTLSGLELPQMIPVVSRYQKGSFAQSMDGLWVIGTRRSAAARRRAAGRRVRAARRRWRLRGARRARA